MNAIRSLLGSALGLVVFVLGFALFATLGFALIGFTVIALLGVVAGKKLGLFNAGRFDGNTAEAKMRQAREAAFERFRAAGGKARQHADKTKASIIIEGEIVDRK